MCKHREYTTSWVKPYVSDGLWVIILCQCKLMNDNKGTSPWRQWYGGGYVCAEAGGKLAISVSSTQFCYDSKTALKSKVYYNT